MSAPDTTPPPEEAESTAEATPPPGVSTTTPPEAVSVAPAEEVSGSGSAEPGSLPPPPSEPELQEALAYLRDAGASRLVGLARVPVLEGHTFTPAGSWVVGVSAPGLAEARNAASYLVYGEGTANQGEHGAVRAWGWAFLPVSPDHGEGSFVVYTSASIPSTPA